jgi:hypothetical protein
VSAFTRKNRNRAPKCLGIIGAKLCGTCNQVSRGAGKPKRSRAIAGIALMALGFLAGCKTAPISKESSLSQFVSLVNFTNIERTTNQDGETVLLSPAIRPRLRWNQLIVSWNAEAPDGTFLKIEANAKLTDHRTKFYTLANWSPDGKIFPRTSVRGQGDADGDVDTDTLILNQPANAAQVRITFSGTNGAQPALKFLGLSFANTSATHQSPAVKTSARTVRGEIIATPERSQHGYPRANGWCSPAALSMVLAHWAEVLQRPELNLAVPQVAAAVYDQNYGGTGNWPFNTAFAGSFPGMRSYVTRLDDLAEVEDWIAAGIPVILSARWDWLRPGRAFDAEGHLIVVIGFTRNGDVVANDPSAHLNRGESVRQIYRRADVIHAWTKSRNAVYLIYPVGAKIPSNRRDHWED